MTAEPHLHPVTGEPFPPEPLGDLIVANGSGEFRIRWPDGLWHRIGKPDDPPETWLRFVGGNGPMVYQTSVWQRVNDDRPIRYADPKGTR